MSGAGHGVPAPLMRASGVGALGFDNVQGLALTDTGVLFGVDASSTGVLITIDATTHAVLQQGPRATYIPGSGRRDLPERVAGPLVHYRNGSAHATRLGSSARGRACVEVRQ